MNNQKSHLYLSLIFIFFIGAFAAIIMSWVTFYGIGITIDSTRYIDIANNLLAGSGFVDNGQLATHYPPLYPLMLVVVSSFGSNQLQAIQRLHIFLYGLNVVLFGLTVFICTKKNMFATALAFLVLFSSEAVLMIHAYAWSESLFLTFTLLGFLLISLYLSSSPHLAYLLLASVFLGLAILSRYVGLAAIPPVLFGLFYFGKHPLKRRIIDAMAAAAIMLMPVFIWLIRNERISNTATDRIFSIHFINSAHLIKLISTLNSFILPVSPPGWMKVVILISFGLALLTALVVLLKKQGIRADTDSTGFVFSSLSIIFSLAYVAVIFVTIAFLDASTPLDTRILSPLFIFLTIVVITIMQSLSTVLQKPGIWIVFTVFTLILVAVNINSTVASALNLSTNGIGYNSRRWNTSKTLTRLKSMNPDVTVYSNLAEIVRFKSGIDAENLPQKVDPGSLIPNQNYQKQFSAMCKEIGLGKAFLAYFNEGDFFWELPSEKDLRAKCELLILKQFDDGFIAGVR